MIVTHFVLSESVKKKIWEIKCRETAKVSFRILDINFSLEHSNLFLTEMTQHLSPNLVNLARVLCIITRDICLEYYLQTIGCWKNLSVLKQDGELAYTFSVLPHPSPISVLFTNHVLQDSDKCSHLLYSWCHLELAVFTYYFYLDVPDCKQVTTFKYILPVRILGRMVLPHAFSPRFWKLVCSLRQQLYGSFSSIL